MWCWKISYSIQLRWDYIKADDNLLLCGINFRVDWCRTCRQSPRPVGQNGQPHTEGFPCWKWFNFDFGIYGRNRHLPGEAISIVVMRNFRLQNILNHFQKIFGRILDAVFCIVVVFTGLKWENETHQSLHFTSQSAITKKGANERK